MPGDETHVHYRAFDAWNVMQQKLFVPLLLQVPPVGTVPAKTSECMTTALSDQKGYTAQPDILINTAALVPP